MKSLTVIGMHQVEANGCNWTIRAKDYPEAEEFRVYAIHGDINRIADLKEAIGSLLTEHGIQRRTILLTI